MKTKLSRFDASEHLRNPEEMSAYLSACMEEAGEDAAFVAKVLGDIARAKGMSQIAIASGLSRESLYEALSGERVPAFDTVLKVCHALGIQFTPTPVATSIPRVQPLNPGEASLSSRGIECTVGTLYMTS